MNPTLDDLLSPQARRFIQAVRERWRPLVMFVGGVAVVAAVVVMLLPQWFAAEATLLPPTEGAESFSMVASLIQSNALNKIGLFSTQTPSDLFAAILKSRTLREELIRRFDLQRAYHAKSMDVALRKLAKHIRIDVDKAGLLIVQVEDRDPQRAADMTNHLVLELDRFNRETYNTRAKRVRLFLEERLADLSRRMAEAESSLTVYERTNKVIASNEASAVEGIASIMAQRLNLQVKRSYVSSYSPQDSPTLRQIDAEMSAYERELAKMPALKQQGARLALEAELQRKLFALMTAQYEDARVQETRDTPTITVLDAARAPQLRARPKRGLVVVASTVIAAALALGWMWLSLRQERSA